MLTRDARQTVVERAGTDSDFARALLAEAATLFLSSEPVAARLILRDLVHATVGFEYLAELTNKPIRTMHRMLSPKGNPGVDCLAAVFDALRSRLKVALEVRVVESGKLESMATSHEPGLQSSRIGQETTKHER